MDDILTARERKTINDAVAIIQRHTPEGGRWFLEVCWHHGCSRSHGATYFSSHNTQHSSIRGETFADRIEAGLRAQHSEDDDQDGVKARRVEQLRKELAELTSEAA